MPDDVKFEMCLQALVVQLPASLLKIVSNLHWLIHHRLRGRSLLKYDLWWLDIISVALGSSLGRPMVRARSAIPSLLLASCWASPGVC